MESIKNKWLSVYEKNAIFLNIIFGAVFLGIALWISETKEQFINELKYSFGEKVCFAIAAIILADTIAHILVNKSIREATMKIFEEQFEKISPDVIKKILNDKLDTNYKNLNDFGIINAYSPLYTQSRINDFNQAGVEILIFKIWIEDLDSMLPSLINASNKGIKVTIIILNPNEIETIRKRASQIDRSPEEIQNAIKNNITMLTLFHNGRNQSGPKLLPDRKEFLKVYTHSSFVSTSLFRIDHHFYVGLYLHGAHAMHGILFKVRENGEEKSFFNKLKVHCINQINADTTNQIL